jgi:hypothetical protein
MEMESGLICLACSHRATFRLYQSEKSGYATGKSALPSRTDIVRPVSLVRFVPKPEITGEEPCSVKQFPAYKKDWGAT